MFVLATFQGEGKEIGNLYTIMAFFGAITFLILSWQNSAAVGVEFGRRSDWVMDVIIGIVACVSWIFLSWISINQPTLAWMNIAFSMGVPLAVSTTFGSLGWFSVVFFASFIETIFIAALFSIFMKKFNIYFSAAMAALIFSAFHLLAYGRAGYWAVTAPYVAAALFAVVAILISVARRNWLSGIAMHMGINWWVIQKIGGG
jgi:hypothetical protein